MNEYNTEKKPSEAENTLFSCEFPKLNNLQRCTIHHEKPTELSFDQWMDCQLAALEAKYAHNITVHSLRSDLKASR